jgi:DNA-binding PadR family transcriptional regulator
MTDQLNDLQDDLLAILRTSRCASVATLATALHYRTGGHVRMGDIMDALSEMRKAGLATAWASRCGTMWMAVEAAQ